MKEYKTRNMNLQLFATSPDSPTATDIYINNQFIQTLTIKYIGYDSTGVYVGTDTLSWADLKNNGTKISNSENCILLQWYNNSDREGEKWLTVQPQQLVIVSGFWISSIIYITTPLYNSTITITNCTCNQSSQTGLSGSYTATITANNGYYLSSVTTTLGTATIATNKKTATITIESISDDFTITATGTAITNKEIQMHPKVNGELDYSVNLYPKVNANNVLTSGNINNGTVVNTVGFDSQGNLVKEAVVATQTYVNNLILTSINGDY